MSAQLVLNAGKGGAESARHSMNGLHYCRKGWELERPTHRYSWMHPSLDEEKNRDPDKFVSRSFCPSTPAPPYHNHYATHAEFAHVTAAAAAAKPPRLELGNFELPTLTAIADIPHDPNSADPLGLPSLLLPADDTISAFDILLEQLDNDNAQIPPIQ